ncbi:hypothetical protein CLI64_03800 [Nostoc sp. CENA543]|uniref:cadherin-like domain-containing protein n=1 Tax=Nostoc sp. CENA543 TaxID=1869241 RepID=UPI000CA145A1|nr:cadherin-like domain-containing protein [Nostoc sp. CENA543]AUS99581.1 hypothetical protein CLI64_03800 [Nostoc sp. CENA543]
MSKNQISVATHLQSATQDVQQITTVNTNVAQAYRVYRFDSMYGSYLGGLTNFNGNLYFILVDGYQRETNAGIGKVDNATGIVTGVPSPDVDGLTYNTSINIIGDKLYNIKTNDYDFLNGALLSISVLDETTSSFVEIGQNLQYQIPTSFNGDSSFSQSLTNINGSLYLKTYEIINPDGLGSTLGSLWKQDASTDEFILLLTKNGILDYYEVNGVVYVVASDINTGLELLKIDPTTGNPVAFTDISLTPTASLAVPSYLMNKGGDTLYFAADDGNTGRELWKIDGLTGNPVLAADINPGIGSSNPYGLTEVNETLYFAANDGTSGYELWKIDQSTGSPVSVTDINPASEFVYFSQLTNINNTLYFSTDGTKLWRIDNSIGNAVRVRDVSSGSEVSLAYGSNFKNINGTVYFIGDEATTGRELWKIDQSTGDAILVKDINLGSGSSDISELTEVNGTVYFRANDSVTGLEAWTIDNSTGNAVRFKDIFPEYGFSNISIPQDINGTLYFVATNSTTGREIWRIDNSTNEPVLVADINPGAASSNPYGLTEVDGVLYFGVRFDNYNNDQLWAVTLIKRSNTFPVAVDDNLTTTGNTPIIISAATLLANDTDADGDALSITAITQPGYGSLIDNSDGTYIYTPFSEGDDGTDTFTYRISDEQGGSSIGIVKITINPNTITGTSASDTIYGTVGKDIIDGLDGNDKLYGGLGDDTINGGAGHDLLDGGVGADQMIGGSGNDIYYVDHFGDMTIETANGGTDLVQAAISWQLGEYIENLVLTGTEKINGIGNSSNNILTGNSAANVLSGGNGNDSLFGLAGNDTLNGGDGNDLLNGGRGRNVLTGGKGRDSFQLSRSLGGDLNIITDFNLTEDKILISKAEFGLRQGLGGLIPSAFRLGTSAITASDRLIYDQATGNLFFDTDGLDGNAQVQIAQFSNKVVLSNTNINVIA